MNQFYDNWCWCCGKILSKDERRQTYCSACQDRMGRRRNILKDPFRETIPNIYPNNTKTHPKNAPESHIWG